MQDAIKKLDKQKDSNHIHQETIKGLKNTSKSSHEQLKTRDDKIKELNKGKFNLEKEIQEKTAELRDHNTELQSYKNIRQQDLTTINELESQLHQVDTNDTTTADTLK